LSLRDAREISSLSFFENVEKKFADHDAVARKVALEGVDVLIALIPNVLGDQIIGQLLGSQKSRMDAHDKNFLVIRTIEDADLAARLGWTCECARDNRGPIPRCSAT